MQNPEGSSGKVDKALSTIVVWQTFLGRVKMSTIGKRLDKIREVRGMTLEEFGIHLGYGKEKTPARQVMSRMVNDHRLPTIDNLKKLQEEGIGNE